MIKQQQCRGCGRIMYAFVQCLACGRRFCMRCIGDDGKCVECKAGLEQRVEV